MKLSDYRALLLNEAEYLHFYNGDSEGNIGEEIDNDDRLIGSYVIIKLIIFGNEYDTVTVAVRGDVDGDGYVTAADASSLADAIKASKKFNYIETRVIDVDLDSYCTVADQVNIANYVKGQITSLNL